MILFADFSVTTSADSFTFAYSTDNSEYINMFRMDAGNPGLHQFTLPSSLNGALYISARDIVRQAGNVTSYTLNIDQLLVRSDNETGTPTPSAPTALTDDQPATSQIQLSASGRKVKGIQVVDLVWTGTESSEIDIYRDGALFAERAAITGTYPDNIGKKGGGTYQYEVCVSASTECSDTDQVVF